MVSIAVVGPSMSGKTHLCVMLAGLPSVEASVYNATRGIGYLKSDVDDTPWHIWDTPCYERSGWPGGQVVMEADVVVVCHDGRRVADPCALVRDMGVDKCVLALTRTPLAGADLSYTLDYFRLTTSRGTLVPVVPTFDGAGRLVATLKGRVGARPEGSGDPFSPGVPRD